jgi:hypothetical protein
MYLYMYLYLYCGTFREFPGLSGTIETILRGKLAPYKERFNACQAAPERILDAAHAPQIWGHLTNDRFSARLVPGRESVRISIAIDKKHATNPSARENTVAKGADRKARQRAKRRGETDVSGTVRDKSGKVPQYRYRYKYRYRGRGARA